ncbi:MAG: sugar ABC transporter permease [Lachnospiraceae bacterium]|nr:sugar ABC transporter permease [Lachnospiraceae bacterium]
MKKQKIKKVKPGRLKRRENMMGYVFILPWLIGLFGLVLYPLCQSFKYSLNRIVMNPVLGRVMTFQGIDNFRKIFLEDPDFIVQLQGYLWQTLLAVPVIVAFALILAIMLNGNIRLKGFFRLIFFLPVIIASGPVMNQLIGQGAASIPMMNVQMITGVFGSFLPKVVADAVTNVFSNIIMFLWYSGVQILIFLAALQKIDSSLYEAAKIDGGSAWECFWKITIPTIKPMMLLNAVYTVIFMSNIETNGIITLIKTRMFSSGMSGGYGYASAMAWCYSIVVTLIVVVFAAVLMGRKDIYERRARKHRREMRKQQRLAKKFRRRGARNERRNAKKAKKAA